MFFKYNYVNDLNDVSKKNNVLEIAFKPKSSIFTSNTIQNLLIKLDFNLLCYL